MADITSIDWDDKVNSPELLAYLEQFGNEHYLSAEEINELKEKINALINQLYPDAVLKTGTVTIAGLTANIAANSFQWRLNKISHLVTPAYSVAVVGASDGFFRKDLIVGTPTGGFQKVQGAQGSEFATEPGVPAGRIKLAVIDIYGDTVTGVEVPELQDYVLKKESNDYVWNTNSAIVDNLTLLDERSSIAAGGSVLTDLKSLYISNLNVRSGKPLFFKNRTNRNIKLWHNAGSGTYKFFFPSGQDLIVKPNEIIEFSLNLPANRFELVGSDPEKFVSKNNQIEVSGNQTAQPSWHGKEVTFTGSGLLTIPGVLPEQYNFDLATDAGVTVTWAITSPKTWKFGTPPTMTEKDFCTVSQRLGTNEIRVRGL